MSSVHVRSRKLIQPSFQLRLIAKFTGLSALALLLQFLLLGWFLSRALSGSEHSGAVLELLPALVLKTLACSLAVLLPVLFGLGVLLTHRIAGPLHRFEVYLGALARGEQSGPCHTRAGDELGSLCDAINAAAERMQALEAQASAKRRQSA